MASSLSTLGELLNTLISQVAANPWDTADSIENVLLYPAAVQPTVNGELANRDGGLVNDSSLRPRASAIIGPGATLRGLANRLLPLYSTAAPPASPTAEELARALVVYHQNYLPASTMQFYRVGLRIPLPIEWDAAANRWVLNSELVRTWSAAFDVAWAPVLDRRPGLLRLLDDDDRRIDAFNFLGENTTTPARAGALLGRILRNPFEVVLPAFEIFRQLREDAFHVALELMDQMVLHQLECLASLTAGSALLQRIEMLFNAPPADLSSDQQTRLTRARNMLSQALRPGGQSITPREVPETPDQLDDRGAIPLGAVVAANEPTGGRHRMVLGRDILAGRMGNYPGTNPQYRGPAFSGRLDAAAFINANPVLLNPSSDPAIQARLQIVAAIAPNEGWLDAVRLRDAGLVSSGLHQWTVHVNNELLPMLLLFKEQAPEDFWLFFRLYGLEVRAEPPDGHGDRQAMLQRVEANGTLTDLVAVVPTRRDFFGGFINAGGLTEFGTQWAARFRMASLASIHYKAAQCQMAIDRFDRVIRRVGNLTVNGVNRPVNVVFSSEHGAALILDQHINAPANVRNNLRAAIAHAEGQGLNFDNDPDAFEQEAVDFYEGHRDMADAAQRAGFIVSLNLRRNHGSFVGW